MIKRWISSITGRFVSKEHVKANPDTTFAYTDRLDALDDWLDREIREPSTSAPHAAAYHRVQKQIAFLRTKR